MMNSTSTKPKPTHETGLLPMTAAQRREASRARRRERLQRTLKAREFARLIESSR